METRRSLLDRLGPEVQREILSLATRRRFKRNEVVFHEGDPGDALHLIEKGHVAIRVVTTLGDTATLTVLGPGDAFGEGALLAPDGRRSATAIAVEGAETRLITHAEFDRLRVAHPEVERFVTDVLAAQVRRLSSHLTEALYVGADLRVLRRLLALHESYRGDGEQSSIPVTQEDLASMAGTTRPTANRVLKAAEAEGIVAVARGRIEVVDAVGLARRAR